MNAIMVMSRDFLPFLTLFYLAGMVIVIPFGYDTALRVVCWPVYIGLDLHEWAEEALKKCMHRIRRPTS